MGSCCGSVPHCPSSTSSCSKVCGLACPEEGEDIVELSSDEAFAIALASAEQEDIADDVHAAIVAALATADTSGTSGPTGTAPPQPRPGRRPVGAGIRQPVASEGALPRVLLRDAEEEDAGAAGTGLAAMLTATGPSIGPIRRRGLSARPYLGGDVLDVDRMSYEELLALCERVGRVKRQVPSAEQIGRLPSWHVGECDKKNESSGWTCTGNGCDCAVCRESYLPGEELRRLPCLHVFHARCIDRWLTGDMPGARLCPICHAEVEL